MKVESDLSGVQVGEVLFSLRFGKVVVIEVDAHVICCRVLSLVGEPKKSWPRDGYYSCGDPIPDLYYPGVQIIPADPPKRVRMERKIGYINLYPPAPSIYNTSMAFPGGVVFPSREYADSLKGCGRIGEAIEITWEIEVEDV